jgi:hypothetical protein
VRSGGVPGRRWHSTSVISIVECGNRPENVGNPLVFFQDTRLPVMAGEQYTAEEIEGIRAERRQNNRLAIFWGVVAVPATILALASFMLAAIMLFRLTMGRPEMVNFFVFGLFGAALLTPAYLFRQFWRRKRDLDDVLASQGGGGGETPAQAEASAAAADAAQSTEPGSSDETSG